uniref:BZIP domain-containing protein n=1 Tax=Cuerna arida TaxID=1464854 RepID=A0A1B6FWH7_9HEMI
MDSGGSCYVPAAAQTFTRIIPVNSNFIHPGQFSQIATGTTETYNRTNCNTSYQNVSYDGSSDFNFITSNTCHPHKLCSNNRSSQNLYYNHPRETLVNPKNYSSLNNSSESSGLESHWGESIPMSIKDQCGSFNHENGLTQLSHIEDLLNNESPMSRRIIGMPHLHENVAQDDRSQVNNLSFPTSSKRVTPTAPLWTQNSGDQLLPDLTTLLEVTEDIDEIISPLPPYVNHDTNKLRNEHLDFTPLSASQSEIQVDFQEGLITSNYVAETPNGNFFAAKEHENAQDGLQNIQGGKMRAENVLLHSESSSETSSNCSFYPLVNRRIKREPRTDNGFINLDMVASGTPLDEQEIRNKVKIKNNLASKKSRDKQKEEFRMQVETCENLRRDNKVLKRTLEKLEEVLEIIELKRRKY